LVAMLGYDPERANAWAGWDYGHFFDLKTRKAARFIGAHPLFCAAIYLHSAAEMIRFEDSPTEDTDWMRKFETRFGRAGRPLAPGFTHSLWLQHGRNINDRATARYDLFVDDLGLSASDWGATMEQLNKLERRLEAA